MNRFRVEESDGTAFLADLQGALAVLAERNGYLEGRIGRNLDDPTLWVLTTRWENVGSYRRALSHYEVKVRSVPLLSRAVDEPSAYELVEAGAEQEMNLAVPRSGPASGQPSGPRGSV